MQLPTGGGELVRKGAWTPEEDLLLRKSIEKYGEGQWHLLPARAGLRRCRKSCRLRWLNYLKPTIKRGAFDEDEVDLIIRLHKLLGNRWSLIAGRIPGRTANDIKNYWNTCLGKKDGPKWWQGVLVDNKVTEGSVAVGPPKQNSPCHAAGIRDTPSAFPSSVIKPKAQIPSKKVLPLPKDGTWLKTSCEPSTADGKPANEEDALSWWRSRLGDDGEDKGRQPQQQWEPGSIISFPSSSHAGGLEIPDAGPWTEEIESWGQWSWEDIFLDADLPLALLRPGLGANQASNAVDGCLQ